MEFGRFAAENRAIRGKGKPETFNFLGFTHISGKDRNGRFMLIRKTRRDRMTATLKAIKDGLRRRWHYSIPEQGKWLRRVVQGYLNYHSVPGNFPTMQKFRTHVTNLCAGRSGAGARRMIRPGRKQTNWQPHGYQGVRVLHPWPVERSPPDTRGRSPVRKSRTPDLCGGYPVTGIPTATFIHTVILREWP
ncbi:hypothetical protein MS6207_04086 [Escherichia coli]|nr:hypothetical protein [Escherichia coli]